MGSTDDIGVKADDIGERRRAGQAGGLVDPDHLGLGGTGRRWKRRRRRGVAAGHVGEVVYGVVICRNQHIAVIMNCHAITEIADDDISAVYTKQLINIGSV